MAVTLLLAGLCISFGRSARVELLSSGHRIEQMQAEQIARGALQHVIAVIADSTPGRLDPSLLRAEAEVVDEGVFWLLHPNYTDDRNHGYGVVRESAKLNINTATSEMLMRLPRMTQDVADAIVDWRDGDDEVTGAGAESEFYMAQNPAYRAKNGAFETVYELLLIRGMTDELFWGEDANHNGVLDPNEQDGVASDPPDNGDGRLDRGLVDLVTVHSSESNTDGSGQQRVNINSTPMGQLRTLFTELLEEKRVDVVLPRVQSQRPYQNLLDFFVRAQLEEEEFGKLYDRISTVNAQTQRGLIDVTTAPREVLMCLTGLEASDADAILGARGTGAGHTHTGWLVKAIDAEKAVAIGGQITTRSYQYTSDIVATTVRGGAFKRYQAVLDATSTPARIVSWLDLTSAGWPIPVEIRQSLRAGEDVASLPRRVGGAIR